MMNAAVEQHGNEQEPSRQPEVGEPVWVQCPGFRCLAYLDAEGKWRTLFRGKELLGQVTIAGFV